VKTESTDKLDAVFPCDMMSEVGYLAIFPSHQVQNMPILPTYSNFLL